MPTGSSARAVMLHPRWKSKDVWFNLRVPRLELRPKLPGNSFKVGSGSLILLVLPSLGKVHVGKF